MQLTVLGNCGSFPGPDGACSGYLVEQDNHYLLLDCGNGVISRAQRYVRIEDLDGIVISHLHADHMADLYVLRYGLETKMARGEPIASLPLYCPGTPPEVLQILAGEEVFEIHYLADGMNAVLGPWALSFTRMEHPVESYAPTLRAGGRTLVYSGDTVDNPRLLDAARGADLLLCEATALAGEAHADVPHLTARRAGQIAAQAGVGQLLLTHLWYETEREEYRAEARLEYPQAGLTEELVTYDV